MIANTWNRHFNLLVTVVIVLGLGAGAALATITRPQTPAVTALPATGAFNGASGGSTGAAQRQGNSGQSGTDQAGQTGRALTGSISAVDADTITVRGQQGDSKVKLANAKVTKTVDGSADDLKAGQQVVVMAQQDQDGSYTANSIQLVQGGQAGRAAFVQGAGGSGGQGANGVSATGTGGQGARSQAQQGGAGASGQGGARAQGQGQNQGQAGGESRSRPIVGSISSFSGDVLAVTTQQGEDKVKVGSARIQKSADGNAKDLQSGQRVVVTGQQGADGSYDATEIQILGAAQ